MNQRFQVLQELGEQFEQASHAAELNEHGSPKHQRFAVLGLRAGRGRLWAVAGVAGGTVVAAVVAAVLLFSTGTPAAYADWAAVPTTANPTAVSAAIKQCYKVGSRANGLGKPVLTEARGKSTAAITLVNGTAYMCLYDSAFAAVNASSMGPVRTDPGPDHLSIPYGVDGGGGSSKLPRRLVEELRHRPISRATLLELDRFRAGDGYGYWVLGQAGSAVSAVRFSFSGHQSVTATVQHGWYFAWWPWTSDPTSVRVTSSAGTITSPMKNTFPGRLESRPYPACTPGANGCAFAQNVPAPTRVTPTGSPIARVIRSCNAATLSADVLPANAFAGHPLIADIRGLATAVVSDTRDHIYVCVTGGNKQNAHAFYIQQVGSFGAVRATPGPDQLSVPYSEHNGFGSGNQIGMHHRHKDASAQLATDMARLPGGGYGPYALGQAGSNVSAVTFRFVNGKTVAGIIHNGWYFAWWPWISKPTSVTVTTKSGRNTSPLQKSNTLRSSITPGCHPGTKGCVFASTRTTK